MSKRYLIHPWVLVYCVNRRLAGEDRGTRDLVAGDGRPPDVDLNTGVVALCILVSIIGADGLM
jgi:hypothetical protein